jgi:Luciferase-like monooxygenase
MTVDWPVPPAGRRLLCRNAAAQVDGAHPGPPLAHPVRIYVGAYGPRMLRLTGRLADGWLPSLGDHYLHPEDAAKGHAAIDEAARAAGRDPTEIERALNVMSLNGTPTTWATNSLASARSFASPRCWSASRNRTPLPSCGASARTPRRACASCSAEPHGHHHYRRQ